MKRMLNKSVVVMVMIMMCRCLLIIPSFAASTTQKCYTISSGNTIVYSDTGLKKKYGTIFGTDELTVKNVTKTYCKVTYPISGGKTKTGFIPTSAILRGTTGPMYKSRAQVTTYKRPGGSKYGYVSKGDLATVLGTYGSYTQLKYPVSGGYKYAFVTTKDYKAYIAPSIVQIPETPKTSLNWQMPMTKAYVCGNDWLEYYRKRPSRPYHLGLDLASRSGDKNVYAAASGTIAATGYNSANGYYVIIKHKAGGNTVYSFYCHLAKKSIAVKAGKSVAKGKKIAVYGDTGDVSQGTHLHFAIVDKLWNGGGYYGYGDKKSGNKVKFEGVTYYNPYYVIKNGKLP